MLIAVNRNISRHRRRLVVVFCAFVLACALMLAHGAVGGMHMGMADHGGMSVDGALAVCLAVTETAAAGLAALSLIGALRRGRHLLRAPQLIVVRLPRPIALVPVGARAGPDVLQVFRW